MYIGSVGMLVIRRFKKVLNSSVSKKLPLYSVFVGKYKFRQVLTLGHNILNILSKVLHTISQCFSRTFLLRRIQNLTDAC